MFYLKKRKKLHKYKSCNFAILKNKIYPLFISISSNVKVPFLYRELH